MLRRLFCSVVNALGDLAKAPLILADESAVAIRVEIDYGVPPIFCDFDEYRTVIAQLIKNWSVYGSGPDAVVKVRVYRKQDMVVTELADNFPGQVQEDSEGGTRMAHELCDTYGGRFLLLQGDEEHLKAVRIALPTLGVIKERRLSDAVRRRPTL
jgi:hypothetical protein